MFCKKCGKEIDDASNFCIYCGVKITGEDSSSSQNSAQPVINIINQNTNTNTVGGYVSKSKWTAFFLCLFFGFLGVHRFYVGKTGTGLIWLFTFGLFGFGALIDLILILVGAFRDKAGQPLR